MMGLALTAILILGAALAARISTIALRYVFWFALGLGAATFIKWGIVPVLGVIALLTIANFFVKGGQQTLHTVKPALVDEAKQALAVGIACAIVGVIIGVLAINSFTLAWMHSIERVRWEEDWHVEGRQLQIVAARVRGSGAGMEPPEDSVLHDGAWHYRPRVAAMGRLILAHSPYTQGYELCADGACRMLTDYLPGIEPSGTIVLAACPE